MEQLQSAENTTLVIAKKKETDCILALAGNPNVGKSTVFNALTGMNQHTGNWPGKTVGSTHGTYHFQNDAYILVDLPGTYSLMAHSTEEIVARDFILFGNADATIVVCDATCLERNLNLVLQVLEMTSQVVVCVNLLDEAKKKHLQIDLDVLQELLGVPVVGCSARARKGLTQLQSTAASLCKKKLPLKPRTIHYPQAIEAAIDCLIPVLDIVTAKRLNSRWLALRLLEEDTVLIQNAHNALGFDVTADPAVMDALSKARLILAQAELTVEQVKDRIVSSIVLAAEEVAMDVVPCRHAQTSDRDRKLDKILTSKITGIPIMLALLCGIFWLTITGANYPSQMIAEGLFWVQDQLTALFLYFHAPDWLHGVVVLGVYRVLAWVISVMLPPMAIFFPLFTLLEDFGYLPRVAFNLDHHFKKAKTCGKQSLTMCMGFGCNAAGVIGCRIIDSPRERLIAILTNNFVPCNGRFPTLIALISMFFVGMAGGAFSSLLSTLILTCVIVLGILLTFWISRLLSETFLKGEPSSFALELPPYRTPQIGKVLVRSIFDRTLFVLGRAIVVAAPAGLLIWLMANISYADATLLQHCAAFLDPFAQLLGLDGVILLAFILGFPANEIVIPIMIMAYLSTNSILELEHLSELKTLLVDNGWTWVTAVSTMLFCLIHWPCSTTCLTIRKEAGGVKWMLLSIAIPTVIGMMVCFLFTSFVRLTGLAY